LLVPPRQPLALAGAIVRLLDDAALGAELGAAARRRVLTDYTPEERTMRLSRLYGALTGLHVDGGCVDGGSLELGGGECNGGTAGFIAGGPGPDTAAVCIQDPFRDPEGESQISALSL